MCTFKDTADAMNYFKDDHFAMENGVQIISLDDKACICSMEIAPRHMNAAGNVMGGAIFTLADFAFAVATNNLHLPSVSQYSSINYLNAVKGSVLYAKTQIVKNGRTSSVIDVEISDDTGLLIARYSGIGAKLMKKRPQQREHYRPYDHDDRPAEPG